MKRSLNLDGDGRILSSCICLEGVEYENIVDELPEGDITDYKYIDSEYVHEPLPEPEESEEQPTQLDVLEAQVTYTAMMTDTLLEV